MKDECLIPSKIGDFLISLETSTVLVCDMGDGGDALVYSTTI